MADGKTAHDERIGLQIDLLHIFCSVQVSGKLVSDKDERRTHQMGKKILNEVFLGDVLREGEWLVTYREDAQNNPTDEDYNSNTKQHV